MYNFYGILYFATDVPGKLNQTPKYVFEFQRFDKVRYSGEDCYVFGRRSSGSFNIRHLDGTKVSAGVSYKKLRLAETRKSIFDRKEKCGFPPPCLKAGVSAA